MGRIVPPPELVQQWYMNATGPLYEKEIATRAAQWGADKELEACVGWLDRNGYFDSAHELGVARRPKPPSLKEQALEALVSINANFQVHGADIDAIRRALEALPE